MRSSHRASNPVPLPGPPDPPGKAPDPHDEGDFEVPDTRSLLDEFMPKLSQSVDEDYKNLSALLKTLPDPSVHTVPIAIPVAEAREKGLIPKAEEWRASWQVLLYHWHSCIDILSTIINDLVGRDV